MGDRFADDEQSGSVDLNRTLVSSHRGGPWSCPGTLHVSGMFAPREPAGRPHNSSSAGRQPQTLLHHARTTTSPDELDFLEDVRDDLYSRAMAEAPLATIAPLRSCPQVASGGTNFRNMLQRTVARSRNEAMEKTLQTLTPFGGRCAKE